MTDRNSFNSQAPPTGSPIEDPALNPVHRQRSASGEENVDDMVYSKHVSLEKDSTISTANPLDSKTKSRSEKDLEGGEGETTPPRAWYWRALRHWKRALFIVVWLLFTG